MRRIDRLAAVLLSAALFTAAQDGLSATPTSSSRSPDCSVPPGVGVAPPSGCKVAASKPGGTQRELGTTPSSKVPSRETEPMEPQVLPGLGTLPGQPKPMMDNVVRYNSHRNEVLYISYAFPNRIATPFAVPKLIDNTQVEFQALGQSLYITPKSPDKPIGLFITGSSPTDPVVSLSLIPRNIPGQTILLQPDEGTGTSDAQSGDAEEASGYTDRLRQIMRTVALGKSPVGFVEAPLPKAVGRTGSLMVSPDKRYAGKRMDVYTYRLENVSDKPVELAAPSFYRRGVLAVSVFPLKRLAKGDATYVFIVSNKLALDSLGSEGGQ